MFPGSCEVSEESDTESEESGEVILPLRDPQYIVIGKVNITTEGDNSCFNYYVFLKKIARTTAGVTRFFTRERSQEKGNF